MNIISGITDYSNAVMQILKRNSNVDIAMHQLGNKHTVRVHLDAQNKNIVVGVFNRADKLVTGIHTLDLK